jgi:mRNA interferase MazF
VNVQRVDIVVVDWPFASGATRKPRPALVVQNDRDNQRLVNTILAMITSVTKRSLEPTQLLIDLHTPEGRQSGLRQDSVVICLHLLTVEKTRLLRTLGSLPIITMQQINDCLKVSLAL